MNLILDTDSYKVSHWQQYPKNVVGMHSYLESRGGLYDQTVFFGLQYVLSKYLTTPITYENIEEAFDFFKFHGLKFNKEGWKHILTRYGGYMPVTIKAVPEGTIVPVSNVLMTVECLDKEAFWIVSWLETMLLRVWYPTTVATLSHRIKQIIYNYLCKTADDPDVEIDFKLHDFGSRGVSSRESAAVGGMAHLVNFKGSDTVVGVECAKEFYCFDNYSMPGFSIPAAEHSTITSWGEKGEADAYANMLRKYEHCSAIAVVSDSYDLWNAIDNLWGDLLIDQVNARQGLLIVRPDSGDPVEVVLECLKRLEDKFGSTTNSKGYKVLNQVRVIQGDGVNATSINAILDEMENANYSATNVAFGMGGGLLQNVNRDTQRFAYKCSEVNLKDGSTRPVFKSPKTDLGKASKKGRFALTISGENQKICTTDLNGFKGHNLLQTVFKNGCLLKQQTLEEIRERAYVL